MQAQTTLTITSANLVSIDLSPLNYTIQVGTAVQYKAIGHFDDGTTSDITTAVTWSSTNAAPSLGRFSTPLTSTRNHDLKKKRSKGRTIALLKCGSNPNSSTV